MTFKEIYGHSRQIGMLQKALASRRVGHAYIFSGIAGIGKKTTALAFASALNCGDRADLPDACGSCPSCLKISRGNHPDIHIVASDTQFIRIDAIRHIEQQMTFRPLEGKRRVFIIDDADKMNDQAANALLKTLEEPTPGNLIILVSARPRSLPLTILSRCQRVNFQPLPADTVARWLVETGGKNTQRAYLLASLSGGSISQALELDAQDLMAFRAELGRLLSASHTGEPMSLLALSAFLGENKKEIRQGLKILNTYFRDALVYKETCRDSMVVNAHDLPCVSSLARRLTGRQILDNIALVERSATLLEMNVNKSLTLETMAFKLSL
jgi:DNA polymerase-3 subunit delta'